MSRLRYLYIDRYKVKYNLKAMIETGTHIGDGVLDALAAGYTPIFTCDVEGGFRKLRSFEDNVHQYIGRSTICLPEMLRDAGPDPALIFLDAHCDPYLFDGSLTNTDGGDPMPLLSELVLLHQFRDLSKDVIIIDDLHIYTDEYRKGSGVRPEWNLLSPPFSTAKEMGKIIVAKYIPDHTFRAVHEIHDPNMHFIPKG